MKKIIKIILIALFLLFLLDTLWTMIQTKEGWIHRSGFNCFTWLFIVFRQ